MLSVVHISLLWFSLTAPSHQRLGPKTLCTTHQVKYTTHVIQTELKKNTHTHTHTHTHKTESLPWFSTSKSVCFLKASQKHFLICFLLPVSALHSYLSLFSLSPKSYT